MNNYTETLKLIKWARKQGALLIKVDGVELTFPPDIDVRAIPTAIPTAIRMNDDDKKAVDFIRRPSALDDPDYYIREQDSWASHTRPPPLG